MELFKLLGTIAIDSSGATKALDDVSEKAESTEGEVSSAVSKIGTVAGNIAKGIGVAGAAIGGAWLAAIEGSREYRAEMALLESAFQTAGHSSTEAKNTASSACAADKYFFVIADTVALSASKIPMIFLILIF